MQALVLSLLAAVPAGALQEFQDTPAPIASRITPEVQIFQQTAPAVVYIETNNRVPHYWLGQYVGDRLQVGAGSGVVVYEDGYLITNYHVVRNAQQIEVHFDPSLDPRTYEADLLSFDAQEDLALLKIEGEEPFPTVRMGTSADLMIGESVLAIGNPLGLTHTMSRGIISGLHRDVKASDHTFTNLIQTDASINPGNSGGPLININGELIGINVATNVGADGIGWAIPVDRVRQVLEDSLLDPSQARAWLGFDVDPDELVVDVVEPASPAAAAGLRPGDRLIALDGHEVDGPEDWRRKRLALAPGRPVTVAFARGDRTEEVRVAAWSRIDRILWDRAGLRVEEVVDRGYRKLRIANVRPEGPASTIGLEPGDVIDAMRQVHSARVRDFGRAEDLALFVHRLASGSTIELDVLRDENEDGVYHRRRELWRGQLTLL